MAAFVVGMDVYTHRAFAGVTFCQEVGRSWGPTEDIHSKLSAVCMLYFFTQESTVMRLKSRFELFFQLLLKAPAPCLPSPPALPFSSRPIFLIFLISHP